MAKRKKHSKRANSKKTKAAESGSRGADDLDAFRGGLNDLQFQAFRRAVEYIRHRVVDFGDDFACGPPVGASFEQAVHDYAPRPDGHQGVEDIVGMFYTLFGLAYVSGELDELHWSQPDLAGFLELLPFDFSSLIRAVSCLCEGYGVSSAPLAVMAYEWAGAFRENEGAPAALKSFADRLPPDRLVELAAPSVQRVLRRNEFEWSVEVRRATDLARNQRPAKGADVSSEVGAKAATRAEPEKAATHAEPEAEPPRRRRHRADLGPEWAYMADLKRRYKSLSSSTLHYYMQKLDPKDTKLDPESKERVVREAEFLSVLDEMKPGMK